jgi:nitrite reductase/ring-hydroxylating ferredoxin subunit
MDKEKTRWVKIADNIGELDFGTNNIAEAEADGKKICIGIYKNELFAFAQKCPHASGYLSGGFIDALGNVVCPLHRYKFCMKNGRNVSGEGYYLKHWPVKSNEDGIFVGLENKTLFGLI